METDHRLVDEALAVREKLASLEFETEQKRVAYHQAIRRLHASGMSMRDVAETLELSHQRVHQIVNGGGPTTASPQQSLVGRLLRRTGKERPPGGKPGEPGGLLLERFYVDAREAMARAQEEAGALHHAYIGTEHLLLGLLRTENGLAARLLDSVGADLEHVRGAVEALLGRGAEAPVPPLPVTPRLKKVLELARQEAKRLHSTHIRSEHILLGLAREGGGLAARMLADLGVGYEHLRRRLDRAALACTFCGRSGLDAVHLIAGPNVYICEHCIAEASHLATQEAPGSSGGSLSVTDEDQTATCSFCGKRRADGTRLVSGPGARICTACLTLCREIEKEERATLNLDRA